jgi:putative oxidoreductase
MRIDYYKIIYYARAFMSPAQMILIVLGRICLSLIFIFSALGKMLDRISAEQQLVEGLSRFLASVRGIESLQILIDQAISWSSTLVYIVIFLELVGGLLLCLGIKPKLGAFFLIIFIIPTTIVMHPFWNIYGPEGRMQFIAFLKNVSILGGLFLVGVCGKISNAHGISSKK